MVDEPREEHAVDEAEDYRLHGEAVWILESMDQLLC